MDLHGYVRAVRRSWLLVLGCVLGCVAIAVALALHASPVYASKVTFFASTPSNSVNNPLEGDQFGQQRVNTYVKLLSSGRLADRIRANTGVDVSVKNLMKEIQGEGDLNTVLFTATVEDSSRARSLAIATAVADQFPLLVGEIESQGGAKTVPVHLDVVSGPSQDRFPVSPNKKLIVLAGLLAGLVLGLGVAIGRTLVDTTVRTVEDLRGDVDVHVIGSVPYVSNAARTPVVGGQETGWRRHESIRGIRTNLKFIDIERPISVLVVTSPSAGEGKSSTAAVLASTFAEAGDKVLLIEADLRRPRVAAYLGLENAVGLTNVLGGDADLEDVTQSWGPHGLHVLASGPIPPNPSELLGSSAMKDLLKVLREEYDRIVIDTSPILPVTDAVVAATIADGALLVARYGKTRRKDFDKAVNALLAVDVRILGAVLNGTPVKGLDAHRYEAYEYVERR